jgi:tRNA wybutosine-synthesizing protein 2
MEERRIEVKREFWGLSVEYDPGRIGAVQVEHVERVKMYAPGVVHAVFDVHTERTKNRL